MIERSGERLAAAISTLISRFKIGPRGEAYNELSLTDAAVVSFIAESAAAGLEPIQKEIGDFLGLPKTTMTSAVKRLGARGLVDQATGTGDGRARTLRLTAYGQQIGSTLKTAQVQASISILESLTPREQDRLIGLLEKVIAKFSGKQ